MALLTFEQRLSFSFKSINKLKSQFDSEYIIFCCHKTKKIVKKKKQNVLNFNKIKLLPEGPVRKYNVVYVYKIGKNL